MQSHFVFWLAVNWSHRTNIVRTNETDLLRGKHIEVNDALDHINAEWKYARKTELSKVQICNEKYSAMRDVVIDHDRMFQMNLHEIKGNNGLPRGYIPDYKNLPIPGNVRFENDIVRMRSELLKQLKVGYNVLMKKVDECLYPIRCFMMRNHECIRDDSPEKVILPDVQVESLNTLKEINEVGQAFINTLKVCHYKLSENDVLSLAFL